MVRFLAKSWRFLVIAALLSNGFPAPASGSGAPSGTDTRAEITERILEHDSDLETRVVGLGKVRLSFPQRLSGSLGAMWVRQPEDYECITVCMFRGPLLQVEPGLAGGQISAGYSVVMGEKEHNEHFLSNVYLAYGVKAALLRTWGGADLTPATQTLVGVEGDFTVIGINFSLGAFHHLGSGDPEHDWRLTGGLGWGY